MISATETFADIIEKRLKVLNTNAFAVEQKFGLPPDAIRNVLRSKKKDGPTLERAKAICEALGLTFQVGEPSAPRKVEHIVVEGTDYAHIPIHEATLSAGPGAVNAEASIIDHLAFRDDWLAKIGVKVQNAVMARVTGESMAPGIHPGDLVLIDTSLTEVPVRKRLKGAVPRAPIYGFVQDGEARVKRIARPDSRVLVLMSDNPSYPPELVMGDDQTDLTILGQVVWSGHVWR